MKNQLERREIEKLWNVCQEIKPVFIDRKKPLHLPLLGSWVLNRHNEGVKGLALKDIVAKRIWAFQYIEHKRVIKVKKWPKLNNPEGEFIFTVNEQKFFNFYKTTKRTYQSKARAQQQETKEEVGLQAKTDPKNSGRYEEENGIAYLIIGNKKVPTSKINTRRSKLVKYLWHPDHFGQALTFESIFEAIGIKKDKENLSLTNPETRLNKQRAIIRDTRKEIQRILKQYKINNFEFIKEKRTYKVVLKNP